MPMKNSNRMSEFSFNMAGMAQLGKKMLKSDPEDYVALEYYLWVKDVPRSLPLSHRYDTEPGADPIKRLFDELPSIYDDHNAYQSGYYAEREPPSSFTTTYMNCAGVYHARLIAYDKAFVHALWPLANSGIGTVLLTSKDEYAQAIWWGARHSFVLWDLHAPDTVRFNSIRNTFMQYLAGLMTSLSRGLHDTELTEPTERKGLAHDKKTSWIYYCWWISIGRPDNLSPFPQLRRKTVGSDKLRDLLCWDKCAVCGSIYSKEGKDKGKKKPVHLFCSGCIIVDNPHYFHLKRRYCSDACRRLDLKDHFPRCLQQKTFIHGACLFESLARRFEEATFTGMASGCSRSAEAFADMPQVARSTLRRASESHVVFPSIFARAPWTGGPVFMDPTKREELLEEAGTASHAMLAWDSGDHFYVRLWPLVVEIFKEHCDQIVELNVYVRNAESISFLGDDLHREDNSVSTSKGKNPMFWPHQVLYCRLRNTGAEFVIDARSLLFGWRTTVLPFHVFAATRLAGMAGRSVSLYDKSATGVTNFPDYSTALVTAGDTVLLAGIVTALAHLKKTRHIHPDNRAKLTQTLGGFLIMRTAKWQAIAAELADAVAATFENKANEVRESRKHRQYLWIPTNPYSHEFRVAVTRSDDELALYERVWMSRKGHRKTIGGIQSGVMEVQDPPLFRPHGPCPGDDAREVAVCWVNRVVGALSPSSEPPLVIDAAAVLGPLATAFEIGGATMPPGELAYYQEIYKEWQDTITKMELSGPDEGQQLIRLVNEYISQTSDAAGSRDGINFK